MRRLPRFDLITTASFVQKAPDMNRLPVGVVSASGAKQTSPIVRQCLLFRLNIDRGVSTVLTVLRDSVTSWLPG